MVSGVSTHIVMGREGYFALNNLVHPSSIHISICHMRCDVMFENVINSCKEKGENPLC